jgi:hypothetical protein
VGIFISVPLFIRNKECVTCLNSFTMIMADFT